MSYTPREALSIAASFEVEPRKSAGPEATGRRVRTCAVGLNCVRKELTNCTRKAKPGIMNIAPFPLGRGQGLVSLAPASRLTQLPTLPKRKEQTRLLPSSLPYTLRFQITASWMGLHVPLFAALFGLTSAAFCGYFLKNPPRPPKAAAETPAIAETTSSCRFDEDGRPNPPPPATPILGFPTCRLPHWLWDQPIIDFDKLPPPPVGKDEPIDPNDVAVQIIKKQLGIKTSSCWSELQPIHSGEATQSQVRSLADDVPDAALHAAAHQLC